MKPQCLRRRSRDDASNLKSKKGNYVSNLYVWICTFVYQKENLKELKSGSILEAYNTTSLFKPYFFVLIKINIYMVMLCQRQSQTTKIFFLPLLKK